MSPKGFHAGFLNIATPLVRPLRAWRRLGVYAEKWVEARKSRGRAWSGERTWEEKKGREKRQGWGVGWGDPRLGKRKGRIQAGGGQKGLALTSRTLGAGNDSSLQSSHAHNREFSAKTFRPRAGGSKSDPEVSVPSPSLPGGMNERGWGGVEEGG